MPSKKSGGSGGKPSKKSTPAKKSTHSNTPRRSGGDGTGNTGPGKTK